MKRFFIPAVIIAFFLTVNSFGQWSQIWTSPAIPENTISGWLTFELNGDGWKSRIYTLDENYFHIMQETYSSIPEFTYTFTQQEKDAGYQLYSLKEDLSGDRITDFYVLSYHGTYPDHRQSAKIFDITTGNILFDANDPLFSYSYPTIFDLEDDGTLECIFFKYNYPYTGNYFIEVYSTGVATKANHPVQPIQFELKQNFPNPFNPSTKIEYVLDNSSNVLLEIFDIKGELVKTVVNDFQNSGNHQISWNGITNDGMRSATGVYFYHLSIGGRMETKKMMLLQ